MISRVCTGCRVEKTLPEFYRERRRASGYGPRCAECARAYSRDWYERPESKTRPSHDSSRRLSLDRQRLNFQTSLKHNYGITVGDYAWMYYDQRCACASCRKFIDLEAKKAVHVDHCHATGRVRGLLCSPCNKALGVAEESIPRLHGMISYLEADRLREVA